MSRHARKIDRSQPQIVADLRKQGVQVVILSANGRDVPDLLLGAMGIWTLCELKEEKGSKLTRGQLEFIVNAFAPVGVATNADEAALLARFPSKHAIQADAQLKLRIWLMKNDQQSLSVAKFREIVG